MFNAGPRSCPGQQMARSTLLITFREMLRRYEFGMGWDGGERYGKVGLTMAMEGGLPVRVRLRG